MRKGTRQKRMCNCGCGRPVVEMYDDQGRFKGYRKRAAKCARKILPDHRAKVSKFMHGDGHGRRKPIGSTRTVTVAGGLVYRQIKTKRSGRWPYEHRVIMERKVGRPLRRSEHVHHKNGDTLDNRVKNLELMSHSQHSSITAHKLYVDGKSLMGGNLPKCPTCGYHHPAHD